MVSFRFAFLMAVSTSVLLVLHWAINLSGL